jgi:hypothetical protein
MDGTNPSIIAVERLRSVDGFHDWVQAVPNSAFLVSLTFKNNHQCDLSTNTQRYMPKLPGRQRKKEVDLLLVDSDMGTLLQSELAFCCLLVLFLAIFSASLTHIFFLVLQLPLRTKPPFLSQWMMPNCFFIPRAFGYPIQGTTPKIEACS